MRELNIRVLTFSFHILGVEPLKTTNLEAHIHYLQKCLVTGKTRLIFLTHSIRLRVSPALRTQANVEMPPSPTSCSSSVDPTSPSEPDFSETAAFSVFKYFCNS